MGRRRYELTDFDWSIIEPLLPDKPRGVPVSVIARLSTGFTGASPLCQILVRCRPYPMKVTSAEGGSGNKSAKRFSTVSSPLVDRPAAFAAAIGMPP